MVRQQECEQGHTPSAVRTQTDRCWCSARVPLFIHSGTQALTMMLLTLKMGFSAHLTESRNHKHAQR